MTRVPVGLAASLAIHAALLAVFALTLRPLAPSQPPPSIRVSLLPPILERQRTPGLNRARPPQVPAASHTRPANTAPEAPSVQPVAPITPLTAPAAPAEPANGTAGVDSSLRAALRGAVGCSEPDWLRLSASEKARCVRRLAVNVDPNLQIPAPMAPEKRAWFDASLAAYHSPGSPPMLGCALAFGGPKGSRSRKPPHSIKFGPLPCYLIPPKGFLTEESVVRPP